MTDVIVRRATPSDAPVVARLLIDFNAEFDDSAPALDVLTARFASLLGRDDVHVQLAERDGSPVGFAFLTLRPTPYDDGPLAALEELYVAPALRDEGVGTALLARSIEQVRAGGGREMRIEVDEIDTDARRFYERHGFTNISPGHEHRMLLYLQEF